MYFEESYIPDLEEYLKIYYNKILEVNLNKDSYKIILNPGNEKPLGETLSGWIDAFAEVGVHEEDKEKFIKNTRIEKMLNDYKSDIFTNFTYRRKTKNKDDCVLVCFMLMPRHTWTEENQEYILFVKDIE